MDGLLLFGRYALAPNTYQYCGPHDSAALRETLHAYAARGSSASDALTRELRELLLRFEAAIPYLQLIANANDIADVFDARVVEAYWLGNALLDRVPAQQLLRLLEERYRPSMSREDWRSCRVALELLDAKPVHSFHVFEIYRRVGLLRSRQKGDVLKTMDNCRISWGTLKDFSWMGGQPVDAIVEYVPLVITDNGTVDFGHPTVRSCQLSDPANLTARRGDTVALHWGFVCDTISRRQRNNLEHWTRHHFALLQSVPQQ